MQLQKSKKWGWLLSVQANQWREKKLFLFSVHIQCKSASQLFLELLESLVGISSDLCYHGRSRTHVHILSWLCGSSELQGILLSLLLDSSKAEADITLCLPIVTRTAMTRLHSRRSRNRLVFSYHSGEAKSPYLHRLRVLSLDVGLQRFYAELILSWLSSS